MAPFSLVKTSINVFIFSMHYFLPSSSHIIYFIDFCTQILFLEAVYVHHGALWLDFHVGLSVDSTMLHIIMIVTCPRVHVSLNGPSLSIY